MDIVIHHRYMGEMNTDSKGFVVFEGMLYLQRLLLSSEDLLGNVFGYFRIYFLMPSSVRTQ